MTQPLKTRIYEVIEAPNRIGRASHVFDMTMMSIIIANIVAVILETVPTYEQAYGAYFNAFDLFSIAVFTVEYIMRLWVCTENVQTGQQHPFIARLKYAFTPLALIDLIAIAPFYLAVVLTVDLRFMRIFRVLRLLKLTRYSPAMETFAAVLTSQRRPLGAALMIMLSMLVFASSVVFMFEKDAQPVAFASIPHAMWWGLSTLTTVGYGDVTPITVGGRIFGAVIMVLGVGMFALPAGILTSGFAREIKKRDFVVTWKLVAGVPLFTNLDAMKISDISALLHPQQAPPRHIIVKRGELADSMYFIVSGEIEVDIHPAPKKLSRGDFFGEIALLKHCERTATVTAITECHLLVLDAHDFNRLLKANPELREPLEAAMAERLAELETDAGAA